MKLNPIITRRSVLAGLGAAGAGSAVGAVTASPHSDENEALLDAWARFNEALAAFDTAFQAKELARAQYESSWPYCPPEIRCRNSRTLADGWTSRLPIADTLKNGDDKEYHHPRTGYVWVATSKLLGDAIALMDGRWAIARQLRRAQQLAAKFEAQLEQARVAAGVPEAKEAFWRADSRLRRSFEEVAQAQAHTPRGAAIKARAIVAAVSRDSEYTWTFAANGKKLAEAVDRVLGGLIDV